MKPSTTAVFTVLFCLSGHLSFAQQQTYDVVSFTLPAGWKKEVKENGVQLYTGNDKTGDYALALIIRSAPTTAAVADNFTSTWTKLVKGTVTVTEEPTMLSPSTDKGWDIVSGQAHYIDGANKGLVTLVTATGNGKMAHVVLMTNADKYQQALAGFLQSMTLNETATPPSSSSSTNNNTVSIPGIWEDNTTETSGMSFANGSPMGTGGYFRKAYTFYADGTYQYLQKNFSAYMNEIFFAWEVGKWSVSGNQLTITPTRGSNEEWSKSASGRTHEWGSLKKTTDRKLEKITYTYEFRYLSGMKETDLVLKYNTRTEREGAQSNDAIHNSEWFFKPPYTPGQPIITLPPGKKIPAVTASTSQQTVAKPAGNASNASLAGKIWEGTSKEKFVGGTLNGYYTGGFFTYQYRFNTDGTYRFVYIGASAYTEPNTLQYETGIYTVNGDQLTITPARGSNEEWSVSGGPVKLAAMSDVQISKIKNTWNKKLKTTNRKLSTYTYTFRVEYMEGNKTNALVLDYKGPTVREGNGNRSYYFETPAAKAAGLPNTLP